MKQCPACKTTYTDETLRFCLADGASLTAVGDEQATFVRPVGSEETAVYSRGGDQMRVEIPQETVQTSPPIFQPPPASGGSSGGPLKILLVVIGLGIFAVLAVAAGTYIYFNMSGQEKASNPGNKDAKTQVSPTPTPTPTADAKDELRDQIANLEKLLLEQKKNNQPANIPLTLPNQTTTTTTARVNSPGDGFLALRTMPNSEAGTRILKIPHGATVSIGGCLNANRVGNRTGRWCRASYNGYSGWVNDGWLIY